MGDDAPERAETGRPRPHPLRHRDIPHPCPLPRAGATVGILVLAVGDSVASLAGRAFGSTALPHNPGKTLVGSFSLFAVGVIIATFFVSVPWALAVGATSRRGRVALGGRGRQPASAGRCGRRGHPAARAVTSAARSPDPRASREEGFLLKSKLIEKKAKLGVIGLGYVGLPLCVEFARAGYRVTGIDSDVRKVKMLENGESYIKDVPTEWLREVMEAGRFAATTDYSVLRELDTVNICVPTPLGRRRTRTCRSSSRRRGPDREVPAARPARRPREHDLSRHDRRAAPADARARPGLKVGEDFFLAFSPGARRSGQPAVSTRRTSPRSSAA